MTASSKRWSRHRLLFSGVALAAVMFGTLHTCQVEIDDGPVQPIVGYAKAFPKLRFRLPLAIEVAPGSTDLYVVEQDGRIQRIAADPATETKTTFLDVSNLVKRKHSEEGLLGLAFHPDYPENGHFFVRYSSRNPDRTEVLSRFTRGEDGLADPDSELVILTLEQPWRNHNGGGIAFGPDGYLYIGFGDGGAAGDRKKAGQDLSTWLGAMLRIDVNESSVSESSEAQPYAVPADNPFVGVDGARPEIWAYGFRNPWRFSFDRATGQLWCGDVGQNAWEEVDIVVRGGNYGWNTYEAHVEFPKGADLHAAPHIPPVFAYPPVGRGRKRRASITGGYVYRGEKFPELRGAYFLADFEYRRMWLLRLGGLPGAYEPVVLPRGPRRVASFGQDHQGELYLVSLDGHIYTLTRQVTEEKLPFPKLLSRAGIFESLADRTPAKGVIGYDVNSPLWSDGAEKQRFIRLPRGKKITFAKTEDWEYPVGSLLVKHFALRTGENETRQLETRVIQKEKDGWAAASYVWNDAQTEATLRSEGATVRIGERSWTVPSRDECSVCHTTVTDFLLGADQTAQLSRGTQLRDLADLFTNPPEEVDTLGRRFALSDHTASKEERARSYLDSNCAGCHQPGGPGNAAIDLRFETTIEASGLLEAPTQGDFGIPDAKIVAFRDPDRSVLLRRLQVRDTHGAMPPIASDLVDTAAVEVIRDWIANLSKSEDF